MIIDTHAHLNDDELFQRVDEIVDGFDEEGISAVINVGYDLPSSERAVALADKYERLFATVGMHPHDSKLADGEMYDRFRELSKGKKVLAIGEIGLDYHYDLSPREVQKKVFVDQLVMAHELKLPTVIHLREGYGDMLELLEKNRRYTEYGILLHCYSGSKEIAEILSKKYDAYFSFGGAITFKNATEKPDVIRSVSTDRILVETDCPYMTPVPYRGRPNEPKYVNLVVDKLAEILGKNREIVEEMTIKNTKEFFKKINDSI